MQNGKNAFDRFQPIKSAHDWVKYGGFGALFGSYAQSIPWVLQNAQTAKSAQAHRTRHFLSKRRISNWKKSFFNFLPIFQFFHFWTTRFDFIVRERNGAYLNILSVCFDLLACSYIAIFYYGFHYVITRGLDDPKIAYFSAWNSKEKSEICQNKILRGWP